MYVHPTFIYLFNSLPNDKIVDLLKVKTFPDNNIKVNEKTEIYRSKPHKTFLEKEKMLVTTISFFPFSNSGFQMASFSGSSKEKIL